MTSRNGVCIESPAHPALAAWGRLRGTDAGRPAPVQRLQKKRKGVVYRLVGVGADGADVVAKWSTHERIEREALVYERVLPGLPVSGVAYHGTLADPDAGGSWLFIGHAGGEDYGHDRAEHRALAARWLAALHTLAGRTAPVAGLADRGPSYYLGELCAARDEILRNLGNPALTADDVTVLRAIVRMSEAVASRWDAVESVCALTPPTVVHADFAPKNIRVDGSGTGLTLLPFDWGSAGWGPPAGDLAQVDLAPSTCWAGPELPVYLAAVASAWPGLSLDDLRGLAVAGKVFRTMTCVNLDAPGLGSDWPEGSMRDMRYYAADLEDAVRAAGWA